MELPTELVDLILSYGDVEVTQRYDGVIRQLKYFVREFDWQHNHNKLSVWYYRPTNVYPCFVLMKNRMKFHLEKFIQDYPYRYVMLFKGSEEDQEKILARRREYMSRFE
jgi:hypothetical protein